MKMNVILVAMLLIVGLTPVVAVRASTPSPSVTVSLTPDTLWPPHHQYVTVEATVTAWDPIDPSPTITLVSVTSNEPDNGLYDGNTVNDIVIEDDFTFKLRAERSAKGSGRIYTITYQATNADGNSVTESATVIVPVKVPVIVPVP